MNCVCGHDREDHGQERAFYECDDSRREVCLMCPGYEYDDGTPGYPRGKAWHRFRSGDLVAKRQELPPEQVGISRERTL